MVVIVAVMVTMSVCECCEQLVNVDVEHSQLLKFSSFLPNEFPLPSLLVLIFSTVNDGVILASVCVLELVPVPGSSVMLVKPVTDGSTFGFE